MTANEFKMAQDELGLRGSDVARILGVSRNSVSAWRCGGAKVPGPVVAWVRVMLRVRDLERQCFT